MPCGGACIHVSVSKVSNGEPCRGLVPPGRRVSWACIFQQLQGELLPDGRASIINGCRLAGGAKQTPPSRVPTLLDESIGAAHCRRPHAAFTIRLENGLLENLRSKRFPNVRPRGSAFCEGSWTISHPRSESGHLAGRLYVAGSGSAASARFGSSQALRSTRPPCRWLTQLHLAAPASTTCYI